MKHLTDEQFEAILSGDQPECGHVVQCESCRERLVEGRAVRSRVRRAFDGLQAPEGLEARIRRQVAESTEREVVKVAVRPVHRISLRRWAMPLAIAAGLLLIVIPTVLFLSLAEPAVAAQEELYRIHQHSVSPHTELRTDADPSQLAEYLKAELGFKPAVPKLGMGMELRGCCIVHFRDKPVGSYVVQTPQGVISVIVVKESPQALGMRESVRRRGHTYEAGSFAKCNMVTLEMGGYTE